MTETRTTSKTSLMWLPASLPRYSRREREREREFQRGGERWRKGEREREIQMGREREIER